MSEEGKDTHHHHHEEGHPPPPPPPVVAEYGSFQPAPQPVVEGKDTHHHHHGHHHHEEGHPPPPPPPVVAEYGSFQPAPQPVVEGKDTHHHHHGHHHHEEGQPPPPPPPVVAEYGSFQPAPQPVVGFPQPVPPPGALEPSEYYARGYQSVPGYVVDERRPVREPRLPCCGIGLGWFLFITGFVFAAIPWYVAAFILLCTRSVDHREKPGYVTCTIAALLAAIAIVFGLTRI